MNKIPRIWIGVPGPTVTGSTMQACIRTLVESSDTALYQVKITNYIGGLAWQNFNQFWRDALNVCRYENFDYAVMLHGDVDPSPHFLTLGVKVMQENPHLGMISYPCAIKDGHGLESCGAGHPDHGWWPYRRLTAYELNKLPGIATNDDLFRLWKIKQPEGSFLIHNNGCWIADPKKPEWHNKVKNRAGDLCKPCFTFPMELYDKKDEKGREVTEFRCNPEDFEFSWMAHQAGIKSAIFTKSPTMHWDGSHYFNSHKVVRPGQPFGQWMFDHHAADFTPEEREQLKREESWFKEL